MVRPTAGTAEVLGLDIRKESLKLREKIGVLHERPSFPKFMKVVEYLRGVTELYGGKASPEALLKMMEFSYASDRRIGQLSAGMYQRLGIALAFAGNPQLVFLDEPTSNLDVVGRSQFLDLIVKLHQESGVSFLISSHILSELERVCNEVAFIRRGRIVEQGQMSVVIEKCVRGKYRIRTPEPKRLLAAVKSIAHVHEVRVAGATLITARVDPELAEAVMDEVLSVARQLNIRVHGFEATSSLEDAFMEVMQDEEDVQESSRITPP